MSSVNIVEQIENVKKRIRESEEVLGRGLLQPFNNTNSGSRKIMFGTHLEHRLPLMNPEVALVQTGYEAEFGEYSSSFIPADSDYMVISKIPKFSFMNEYHYFVLLLDRKRNELTVIERVSYKHITETYGYMLNNQMLDLMKPNDIITKGTVLQKSKSYDDYNNRMDGVNLITAYVSNEKTMEDGIRLSKSAAKKLSSPLLKKVTIIINDNDIPLNLYGDNAVYKMCPDIGEETLNGTLCAIRREKKEESLFTQSYDRLRDIMMSDEKYPLDGKVIDVNIYCNNPENLSSSYYNIQLKKYYDENIRFNTELFNSVNKVIEIYNCKMSYDLQKLYSTSKRIISGDQYSKDRSFSNIILEIVLLEEIPIQEGDKLSDRYGGKGVVSQIVEDWQMPQLDNGAFVEISFNGSTCVNRENPGQLFETSITHIGSRVIDYINLQTLHMDECLELYRQYVSAISKDLGNTVTSIIEGLNEDEQSAFINSVSCDNGIMVSIKPISESFDIDKLDELYKLFPWATQYDISVPITDSNGNIRRVQARRPLVCGKKYIYRLKQYAEEKFSATSLSSTNIRNENSRSKANKNYKALYTKTPIKFGEMETGDMSHLGMEAVIINLMLHSASPHGRRLSEELLTGDPFNIDIRLDEDSKNRNVEILNAYFKTMGLKLVFEKIYKKKITPALITPAKFYRAGDGKLIKPAYFVDKGEYFDIGYLQDISEKEYNNGLLRPALITPAEFLLSDKLKK